MRQIINLSLILVSIGASAQDRYLIDWEATGEESINHLVELVRINTANPPGNETEAANYIKAVLASEGIDSELYALEADRAK